MRCLASAKMSMLADIVKPSSAPEVTGTGHWEEVQDPDSGAIIRVWVDVSDNPNTPIVEGGRISDVPCLARGVIGGGLAGQGTTQRFDDIYQNIEWIKVQFPANYVITIHDKVTNIRDGQGNLIWRDFTRDGNPATVFNVMGVTPVIGPFGKIAEWTTLLKRSSVQIEVNNG